MNSILNSFQQFVDQKLLPKHKPRILGSKNGAWYRANGDAIGSAVPHQGTLENGATFASGMLGQAFSFHDTSNQYVVVPDADDLVGFTSATISAWIKQNSTREEGGNIMRKSYRALIGVIATLLLVIPTIAQDEAQSKMLAKRLVQSASVKKGDVVMITGGTHMVRLMEDIAIEAQKAGAFANMWLSSDRVQRAIYLEEPDEFLGQKNDFWLTWYGKVDVVIDVPQFEDYLKIVEGVSETRIAKSKGSAEDLTSKINTLPIREIAFGGVPSASDAKFANVDLAELRKMTWNAIGADYKAISVMGARLKALFQKAKQVHVTNPNGTDLSFSMAEGRPIFVDDGILTAEEARSPNLIDRFASLPTGSISFAPLESSANGKVAVAKDNCRDGTILNSSFEFKSGKLINYTAATNKKCFPEAMAPYTGPKDVIGGFSIGLNPEMKIMDAGDENYIPASAAGLVFVSIGSNKFMGGENISNGPTWGWAITKATVTVDGKVIVKDGKLVF